MKLRLCFLALALVASVFVVGCGSSSPSGVAKDFMTYLAKGDGESAFNLISTTNWPKEVDQNKAKERIKEIAKEFKKDIDGKGGLKSVNIKDEKITGDKAEVKGTITYGNGTEDKDGENEPIQLVKENGHWKILFPMGPGQ